MAKIISAIIAVGLFSVSAAQAEELKIGCMPREELGGLLKANKQSRIDQYMRQTAQGEVKTTITGLHNGVGYPDKGRGYIIEAKGDTGCIIAKTRVQNEPDNKLSVATVHSFGRIEMTAAEWKHSAKYVKENRAKKAAEYKAEGMSDQDIKDLFRVFEIIEKHDGAMPNDVNATFLYQFGNNEVKPLKRSTF